MSRQVTIKSKARIYLNEDKTKALPEGHKDARTLLVIEGAEILESELEKYEGAKKLAGSKESEDDPKTTTEAKTGDDAFTLARKAEADPKAEAKHVKGK